LPASYNRFSALSSCPLFGAGGELAVLEITFECEPNHKEDVTKALAFGCDFAGIQTKHLEELMTAKKKSRRWVAKVTTDSTHPPAGLFTKDAATIARTLASKKVSPKGPGSGMRMLTYFINRAGRGLPAKRRSELEKAKLLLSKRVKESRAPNRKAAA
jgi:Protein of unknown function (DUF3175)